MFKMFVWPVLKDRRSWKWLALTVGCALLFISVNVWYTYFLERWLNAFQDKNFPAFKRALLEFCVLAFAWVATYGYREFFRKRLSFVFREVITDLLVAHYKKHKPNIENLDQRIANDPINFSEFLTSLALAAMTAFINLPLYLFLLIKDTPWYVSVMGIAYAIFTTMIASRISKPLQKLDYEQETREANFRYQLVQVRDGKTTEIPKLDSIMINWLALAKRAKILSFFQSGQSLASNMLPLIVLAPTFFLTGGMTIGSLWKIRSIYGEVSSSLSFFVDSYDRIASLKASAQRMTELMNKKG